MNRCSGEWNCDLTDEEIEKKIPDDYKYNKKKFNEIANDIIKNYDKIHKNEIIKVPDFVKVGMWITKNIEYDISFYGKSNISATETYNVGRGVCHHFTKLYNAFLYSLGYKCVYVSGYACDKKNVMNQNNGHAWTLINVNNKWLPLDATWGIFSGKLPVCHIFKSYFSEAIKISSFDSIKLTNGTFKGKFL